MKPTCSIIVPTWNNAQFVNPCIDSIAQSGVLSGLAELIIVNNGEQNLKEYCGNLPNTRVLEPGKNLGWEGGLQYGLEHTDAEFVCFQNDDTFIPKATQDFYQQLLWPFQNQNVAAVGPATTIASGWHSIFNRTMPRTLTEVAYLIFFTVMLRRSDLNAAGGIDITAPGGDDFDLSIRLRKLGKKLFVNPDAFLIHHAFKTGTRVHGEHTKPGGWNSKEMSDNTNKWLIQKHGFSTFLQTMRGLYLPPGEEPADNEGDMVRDLVGSGKTVELGCGFRKTVPDSIGIDIAEKGSPCNHLQGPPCVADIQADITKPLPLDAESVDTLIARHILEHIVDPIASIRNWSRVLKTGGRMIIAVPNQDLRNTIPLNPEHVHAYTPDALRHMIELCGFRSILVGDPKNGISFVSLFEKVPTAVSQRNEITLEVANA